MSTGSSVRSVADALEDAARWRAEEEARQKSELVDKDQQLAEVRLQISKLQDQLAAHQDQLASLEEAREGLTNKQDALDSEQISRTHDGLFAALEEQREALKERSEDLVQAEAGRWDMVEPILAESDLAGKLEEYRQFKTAVEPSLQAMPESYRSVVMGHHEQVVAVLRERVSEMMADPVHAEGGTLPLELVYAVDAPDGSPELLVVVTPVTHEAYEGWAGQDESLALRVAARAVQAVYEACHSVGFSSAEVMCGGHRGLLALEVDLEGAPVGIEAALESKLAGVGKTAELHAGKVTVAARLVEADYLLPPDGADEEDDDA